ncbi:MAG: DnaJ C-terminal domain-containing protein [Saprospiraceae bacterium]
MAYKNYYKILGINRDATMPEVEAAYLKISERYNSPKLDNDELSQKIRSEIAEAFMVLGDPQVRLEYDAKGSDWEMPESFYNDLLEEELADGEDELTKQESDAVQEMNVEDLAKDFKSFFEKGFKEVIRRSRQQQEKAKLDIHLAVPFTLSDALNGSGKTIELEDEEIEIRIPKGALPGQKLRFENKGNTSEDGQIIGDLWVTLVGQPHSYFFRRGNSILYHASVDMYTALLGGKITVPSLDGKIKMDIPKGLVQNARIKVEGEGLPDFNEPDKRGDFFVELHLEIPKDLSEEEIALIKQLRDLRRS